MIRAAHDRSPRADLPAAGGMIDGARGNTLRDGETGEDSGSGTGRENAPGAQAKRLNPGEVRKLELETGELAHRIKTEALGTRYNVSRYDLYKDSEGNIFVKAKDGTGEAIPTGLKIR
jgi:hypothetical protein